MSLNPKIEPTHLKDEENQRLLTPEQIEQVKDYFDKNPNAVKLSRRDPAAKLIFGEASVLEGFSIIKLEDPDNPGSFKLCAVYIGKARNAEDPSRLLGEGGFGRVKLGQMLESGDWVALKIQKVEHDNVERLEEIAKEDEKLKALGEAKGTAKGAQQAQVTKFYTAMVLGPATDYKEGVNELEKRYVSDPTQLREKKLQIGILLANTVDAWHKAYQWVHRDLKPANILLDPNQNINTVPDQRVLKIIDFGSSGKLDSKAGKYTHADPSQRLEGMTTGYIAPELISAGINGQDQSSPTFTPETDAYAIGRMLCETFHPAGVKLASHILTPQEQMNTQEFMAKYYTESTFSEIPPAFFKDRLVYVELIDVLSDMPERLKHMKSSDISLREVLFNSVHPDPSQRLTLEEISAELEQISRFDALFEQISKENQTKEIQYILGKTGERQIDIAKKLIGVMSPDKISDLHNAVEEHDKRLLNMQKKKLGKYIQNLEFYIARFEGCNSHREKLEISLQRLQALLGGLGNIPLSDHEIEELRNIRIVCNKLSQIQSSHKVFLNNNDVADRLISQYREQKGSEVTVEPLKLALHEYENSIVAPDWNMSIESILQNIEEKRKAYVRQKEILEASKATLEVAQRNEQFLSFVAPKIVEVLEGFNTQPALEAIKNYFESLVREVNESRATIEVIQEAIINESSSLVNEKVWVEFQDEIETLLQNMKQADISSQDDITDTISRLRNAIGMVDVLRELAEGKSEANLVSQFAVLKKHLIELEKSYRLMKTSKNDESEISSRTYKQVMGKFKDLKVSEVSRQEYAFSIAKIREEFSNVSMFMISAIQNTVQLQPQAPEGVKHSEDAFKDIVPLFDGDHKIQKVFMEMSNFLSGKKEEADFRKEHLNPDVATTISSLLKGLEISLEKAENLKAEYYQDPTRCLAELEKEMKVFRATQQILEKKYKNIVFLKKPKFDDLVKMLSSSIEGGKSKIVVPEIPSIKFEYRTNGNPRFPRRLSSGDSPKESYLYILDLIDKSSGSNMTEQQKRYALEILEQINQNIISNKRLKESLGKKIEEIQKKLVPQRVESVVALDVKELPVANIRDDKSSVHLAPAQEATSGEPFAVEVVSPSVAELHDQAKAYEKEEPNEASHIEEAEVEQLEPVGVPASLAEAGELEAANAPSVNEKEGISLRVEESKPFADSGEVELNNVVFDINNQTSYEYLKHLLVALPAVNDELNEFPKHKSLIDFIAQLKKKTPGDQYISKEDYNALYTELHRLAADIPLVENPKEYFGTNSDLNAFHIKFFIHLYENEAPLNQIVHQGLELNTLERNRAQLILSKLEEKGAAVKRYHFTHPGHAINEIKGAVGFRFNPLGETNRPYVIFGGAPKILRFGTQITGYATLQPAFLNYLAVKKAQRTEPQKSDQPIHHVYFNLMKRPIAVKELDIPRRIIESLKTKALEKLNKRDLGIAVVTLPAAGRYFTRGYLIHEGRAKRPSKRYDCVELKRKTIKSILNGKNDFYIPKDVLDKINKDSALENAFQESVKSILGEGSERTMITAEERQAILFDFIKYRLPKMIIKELKPDTVNFSCKDAIDRGGVNTLWYEFRRRLDAGVHMGEDEFNMNLDAAALLVKSRPANENRNLLWNALNLYYEKNQEKFEGEMSWVKKWIEDNHPNKEALNMTTSVAIKEALDSYKIEKFQSRAKKEAIRGLELEGQGELTTGFVEKLFSTRKKVMDVEGKKSDLSGRFYEKTDEIITRFIRDYKKNSEVYSKSKLDELLIKDVVALLSQIAKQCPNEAGKIQILNKNISQNQYELKQVRTILVQIKLDIRSSNPDLAKVLDRKIGQIEELQIVAKPKTAVALGSSRALASASTPVPAAVLPSGGNPRSDDKNSKKDKGRHLSK